MNNAGAMLLGNMDEQSVKDWNLMLDVNIKGVLNGIKSVIQGMKKRKSGTIISISSMAGKKLFSAHVVYCATKFAVQAIAEGVRMEVALSNVRSCVICPGVVKTNLLGHNDRSETSEIFDGYNKWVKTMELGVLLPEDVASACLYVYQAPPRACIRELQIAPTNQVE